MLPWAPPSRLAALCFACAWAAASRVSDDDADLETDVPAQDDPDRLQSGVPCDQWDAAESVCWFRRQVGDTLTLWLRSGGSGSVVWRRRYRALDESRGDALVTLRRDNAPWNVALGAGELRISPITDSDLEPNSWEASAGPLGNISFRISILALDLGPVFRGDQVTLHIEHFLTLPLESLQFRWELEGGVPLAANMKVSPSGRSLRITGLRRSQGGVLACSIFSSTGLLVARRRFLVREPQEEPLPEIQSRLVLAETKRVKRSVLRARRRPHRDPNDGMLLSRCSRATQCSLHAQCSRDSGYCLCADGYLGNGLFCWEDERPS
ncbi:uncharacterized protein LOC115319142 [Ixodes scapularis]|uniref:uncharacterized protein LOC115319142 n=1 Tax=Ixodes scapularis TaxID=6945 RepID=UPI001C393CD9|nr:uncharacterized protein LOC115319142 [Ixodes scapularis]